MTLSSLAARIMARGEYPYRQVVRTVSPVPPHAPEPHPGEPFAPVYDYAPLGESSGLTWLLDPYGPDPVVFGAPGSVGTRDPDEPVDGWPAHRCGRCDVGWSGDARCWNCGRPG